jgi:monoamine oxidase
MDVAREAAAKHHEEFADDSIVPHRLGVSIAWHKTPHQLGAWADWRPDEPEHKKLYSTLIHPQGRNNFLMIGDQVSALPGWQEGALMSAEWAYEQIAARPRAARLPVRRVPDARSLTT